MEPSFLLADLDGFTPHISRLVCMMTYVRYTTLEAVKGMSQTNLDARVLETGNSVGMLLSHMAEVEQFYQANTFGGEYTYREGPSILSDYGRKHCQGNNLEHYLNVLAESRERTLTEFSQRDDTWLHEAKPFGKTGRLTNNYFKWFHVFEDEINHRGQIRLIRKLLQ